MLGYADDFKPKFAKQYANLHETMLEAFKQYKADVESRAFPAAEHTFAISEEIMKDLTKPSPREGCLDSISDNEDSLKKIY